MPLKFNAKNLSDSIMAIAAVVVILMIIIPLPTVLLDMLMACNLLASLLILLNENEYFISNDDYPAFQSATIRQIANVEVDFSKNLHTTVTYFSYILRFP